MKRIDSTNQYYYNTAFAQHGYFSNYIWVEDTNGNSYSSSSSAYSMPPNWDVNKDGVQNVLDLVSVSNYYGSTGNSGWIREDVDNNGIIQVLDFVKISNHYGEVWWV